MKVYEGLKINFIEVLSNKIYDIDGKKYYRCKCDCGNEKYILTHTIQTQRIRDCGCGEFARKRLIGQKFGKLLVVGATRNEKAKKKNIICICKCDCGNTKNVIASKLTSFQIVSCGCSKQFDFNKYKNKTFGKITILDLLNEKKKIVACKCECGNVFEALLYDITGKKQIVVSCGKCSQKTNALLYTDRTRLSSVYFNMLKRCYNKNDKDYQRYGGRGIKVCDNWLKDKNNFISWALANGYQKNLTIDRINNDGNYEPNNCRWVDMKTQQNNRNNNVKFLYENEYLSLSEIARKTNFKVETLRSRLRTGMSLIEATTTPLMRKRR